MMVRRRKITTLRVRNGSEGGILRMKIRGFTLCVEIYGLSL